jgi:hypothetical protein
VSHTSTHRMAGGARDSSLETHENRDVSTRGCRERLKGSAQGTRQSVDGSRARTASSKACNYIVINILRIRLGIATRPKNMAQATTKCKGRPAPREPDPCPTDAARRGGGRLVPHPCNPID